MPDLQRQPSISLIPEPALLRTAALEPANLVGIAGFVAAAAITQSIFPLIAALVCEAAYLLIFARMPWYRRRAEARTRLASARKLLPGRNETIAGFTKKEREAVESLRWQMQRIQENYLKFTGAKVLPTNLISLEKRWEDFVDLLDVYRRRKQHLQSVAKEQLSDRLTELEREHGTTADEKIRRILETDIEITKKRLASFEALEQSVRQVESELESIENFFGYLNGEILSMSTPEKFSSLDFEHLSDSIALTKQMIDETSEVVGQLDALERRAQS